MEKSYLDELYYSWCNERTKESQEVETAFEELNKVVGGLEAASHIDKMRYILDDTIMDACSASQKQGFMAGFEIARQLMIGGAAHESATSTRA